MLSLPLLLFAADDSAGVRSSLNRFNQAVSSQDRQALAALFTTDADYRDGHQSVQGAAAITSLLTGQQLWTEQTRPTLQEQSIKLLGPSTAFVDAQLVQYGSVMGKSSVPVVLILKQTENHWKIFVWRTP